MLTLGYGRDSPTFTPFDRVGTGWPLLGGHGGQARRQCKAALLGTPKQPPCLSYCNFSDLQEY